jgi:hypothetical protein
MKTQLIAFFAFLILGCGPDSAIDQLNDIKKPAIVFSKHTAEYWYEDDQLTIQDADGELIEINGGRVKQLCNKFNVGDTIR